MGQDRYRCQHPAKCLILFALSCIEHVADIAGSRLATPGRVREANRETRSFPAAVLSTIPCLACLHGAANGSAKFDYTCDRIRPHHHVEGCLDKRPLRLSPN
jgi:hypothetical protein